MEKSQLYTLLDMNSPEEIFKEIEEIFFLMFPNEESDFLKTVFFDMTDLFAGRFPGYFACDTEYHDLFHTMDVSLAFVRLFHGAYLSNKKLSKELFFTGFLSAIFHDSGYIRKRTETTRSGAIFAAIHVQRSIDFVERYIKDKGFNLEMIKSCSPIILSTDLSVDFSNIKFPDEKTEFLGKILATADLSGQMADRVYLEKILFLYNEMIEGSVAVANSEFDMLTQTVGFYQFVKKRFQNVLDNVIYFFQVHFENRWNINKNLYLETIDKNIDYLSKIIEQHKTDYKNFLRRDGLVEKLEKKIKKRA